MAYTEFYVNPDTGANVNAGDGKAIVTSVNGDWGNAAANRFTAASGTPFSGVSAGGFASVYLDGASVAVYIARVTAVNGGGASIDLSTTAKSGTAPTTGATGRTCTVGGAWLGPNGSVGFPFSLIAGTLTDSAGNTPRVNLKKKASPGVNGQDADITAGVAISGAGLVVWQGYTSSVGDGGRFIIDGGDNNMVGLTVNTASQRVIDVGIQNTGTADNAGVSVGSDSTFAMLIRCSAKNVGGHGFTASATTFCIECAAGNFNRSATTSGGGRYGFNAISALRCIAHSSPSAGSNGFLSYYVMFRCIADGLSGVGFESNYCVVLHCDAYACGAGGFSPGNTVVRHSYFENCNAINCGTTGTVYGYNLNSSGCGVLQNCGSYGNRSGRSQTVPSSYEDRGPLVLSGVPFADVANHDFGLVSAETRGTGKGSYLLDLYASPPTFAAHPDVGAASEARPTLPAIADVLGRATGINYGYAGSLLTGTASAGGGGGSTGIKTGGQL